jgi:WD40 repeat protein
MQWLEISDIGVCGAVSQNWRSATELDILWRQIYETTQRARLPGSHTTLSRLINRPFREKGVGWQVRVYQSDETWLEGRVLGFEDDKFHIEYTEGELKGQRKWEVELRDSDDWHRRGKSRIEFLSPASSDLSEELAATNAPFKNMEDVNHITGSPSAASSNGHSKYDTWKQEAKQNTEFIPKELVLRLCQHTDEVLDASFSPDGKMIATCSRDLSTLVYTIDLDTWNCYIKFRFLHESAPCRLAWSPSSDKLVICTEEPQGNPFGVHSRAELWDLRELRFGTHSHTQGASHSRVFPNMPFDIHSCWMPCGRRFITGGGIQYSDEDGALQQVLAVWNDDGTLHMQKWLRFERAINFAHMLQVSHSGHWCCYATAFNPYLVHIIRIVSIYEDALVLPDGGVGGAVDASPPVGAVGSMPPSGEMDIKAAILSIRITKDDRFLLVNCRPFIGEGYKAYDPSHTSYRPMDREAAMAEAVPDLATQVELQVWDVFQRTKVAVLTGHLAFTTKDCPFLLFTDEGGPCGSNGSGNERGSNGSGNDSGSNGSGNDSCPDNGNDGRHGGCLGSSHASTHASGASHGAVKLVVGEEVKEEEAKEEVKEEVKEEAGTKMTGVEVEEEVEVEVEEVEEVEEVTGSSNAQEESIDPTRRESISSPPTAPTTPPPPPPPPPPTPPTPSVALDYVCSGSEDHNVYVWHRRHCRLLAGSVVHHTPCTHTPIHASTYTLNTLIFTYTMLIRTAVCSQFLLGVIRMSSIPSPGTPKYRTW